MRRIIHNTTAIAACLSLLVPQLAQARALVIDDSLTPQEGGQDAPVVLAQAETQVPPPPAQQPGDAAEPAPEPDPAPASTAEAPEPEAAAPEPVPADAAPAAEEPAQAESVAQAPAADGSSMTEESTAEKPMAEEPAAEEPAAETAPDDPAPAPLPEPAAGAEPAPVPDAESAPEAEASADEMPDTEASAAEATAPEAPETETPVEAERATERQPEPEQTVESGPAERPVEAAREQEADRPVEAAREQEAERPAAAARQREAERPTPRAGEEAADDAPEQADPLREALEGEQAADDPGQPQAGAEAASDRAANDEDALRDALAAEQPSEDEAAADPQEATADPAASDARPSESARRSARETRAAPAAALDDAVQGEVVEQRITRENSRSSDEDFATSLRDALQPQAASEGRRADRDDGDDNNDLAKALLLGLGAVAVGSYLNNNRQVALSAPDRVVVTRADGSQEVIKDEVALLRQPGSTVATENFDDGSSRTVVTRADGSRVVTIRDADLRVLRRTLVSADGTQTRLIDDTAEVEPVDIAALPAPAPAANPAGAYQDEAALRRALQREAAVDRRFTLGQVRSIPEVRALVPPVTLDAITFDSGSAAITPDQARQLSTLGKVIQQAVAENPREMFLIEGHTDTVGSDAANLALSDRRAESVALALTEYFEVPPENLVVQGYGEQDPQIRREGDIRENRRAAVRQITSLLQTADGR